MADTFEYHDPEPNVIDDWTYTVRMLQEPEFMPWAVAVAHEMHEEKIEQHELARGID